MTQNREVCPHCGSLACRVQSPRFCRHAHVARSVGTPAVRIPAKRTKKASNR